MIARQGGVHPHRDAGRQREQRRGEGEFERRRQAFDEQRGHRPRLAQAQPEIPVQRAREEVQVLDVKGLVQAEQLGDARVRLGRRVLPEHGRDRVADEGEQRKRDQADREHDQHGLGNTAQYECEHVGETGRRANWGRV